MERFLQIDRKKCVKTAWPILAKENIKKAEVTVIEISCDCFMLTWNGRTSFVMLNIFFPCVCTVKTIIFVVEFRVVLGFGLSLPGGGSVGSCL